MNVQHHISCKSKKEWLKDYKIQFFPHRMHAYYALKEMGRTELGYFKGVILLAVSMILTGCMSSDQQSVAKVQRVSDIELGPTSQKKFEEFSDEYAAYGAMYVTESGRGGGRSQGLLTVEGAKDNALSQCESFNSNQSCVLYAIKTP